MLFGKYINKYYKKYWYLLLGVILVAIFVDVIQLFVPQIIGSIVKAMGEKGDPQAFITNTMSEKLKTLNLPFYASSFTFAMISIAVIAFFLFLGRCLWRLFAARLGGNIARDMRRELFAHIQTLSLDFYRDKKVGGLLSYFTNDINDIQMVFREGFIFLIDLVFLGTMCYINMSILSPLLALCTGLPLIIFTLCGGYVGKIESEKYKLSSDAFEKMSDYTEESLQGFSVVKAFRRENKQCETFSILAGDAMSKNIVYHTYSAWIDAMINIVISIVFVLLAALGSFALLNPSSPFRGNIQYVGDLVTFYGYNDSLIWPMIAGGLLINDISIGRGAYKRIASIFSIESSIKEKDNLKSRDHVSGDIEFRNLSFSYRDKSVMALDDISFHVKPGMVVGIVGKTGSGKSTIPTLLLKLENVKDKSIFIDGVDINDWKKEDLRKHIALVNQESFLFSGTIIDSVSFAKEEKPDTEKVIECCKFASIDEDIQGFEKGYLTEVGEKGTSLSGGQRQRISIARAIYSDPDVLILDDSLSAVDAETEKNILKSIREQKEKKLTTFVITHRISAIKDADLIIVLDSGKLIGIGKHEQLEKTCNFYKKLCMLQDLEKEVN